MSKIFLFSLTFFFFYEINVYAYIDPGIGSIILQGLAGAIAAVTTFFYYYGKKIKDFFKKFKKNNQVQVTEKDNNKEKNKDNI